MIVEQLVGKKEAKGNYASDVKSEKPIRSIAKAISWRIVGTIDTFVVAYFVLGEGKWREAVAISGVDFVTKMFLYFFHERVWNKIKWGK